MAVWKRWRHDSFYTETVFRGTALDIGAAGDPLARYRTELPNLTGITALDYEQAPPGLNDVEWIIGGAGQPPEGRQFDLVYSSHCLEHLPQSVLADTARRWWAAVKPGGHLLIIVPDMEMYERGHWPSKYNGDHKTTWVVSRADDPDGVFGLDPEYVCGLRDFVADLDGAEILRCQRLTDGYRPEAGDQTGNGECESGIEIVVRRNQ
jgi:SAM-dependent methyltransferase